MISWGTKTTRCMPEHWLLALTLGRKNLGMKGGQWAGDFSYDCLCYGRPKMQGCFCPDGLVEAMVYICACMLSLHPLSCQRSKALLGSSSQEGLLGTPYPLLSQVQIFSSYLTYDGTPTPTSLAVSPPPGTVNLPTSVLPFLNSIFCRNRTFLNLFSVKAQF